MIEKLEWKAPRITHDGAGIQPIDLAELLQRQNAKLNQVIEELNALNRDVEVLGRMAGMERPLL